MRAYVGYESEEFSHLEDMRKILAYLRAHGELQASAIRVQELYSEFSAGRYAGWLGPTDEIMQDFACWLEDIDL